MNPPTINTPATPVGVASASASGTLSTTDTGNPRVDLAIGTCSGGGGTFALSQTTNIGLSMPVTINVTYTPSASGMRSCMVNVYATGTTSNALTTFTITGDGKQPAMLTVSDPIGTATFAPVRFLDTAVAAHISTRTIKIDNSGDFGANVTAINFTNPEFSLSAGSTGTIAGKTQRSWTIAFNPSVAGTRTGKVTFVNDSSTPNIEVDLTGDGTTGMFTTSTGAIDFQTVASGSSATVDVTLTHSGSGTKGTLTITDASIVTPSTPGWFSVTGSPSTIGPPGANTGTVTVQCAPPANATTTETATLSVTADVDSGPATMTSTLTCKGGAPVLALDMASIDFGSQLVGDTTTTPQKIRISNSGTQPATVSLASTSANASRFSVTGPTCSAGMNTCSVTNGSFIDVDLTFTPNAEGTVSASYTIAIQGQAGAPTTGFTLKGKGIDRHILLPEAVQLDDTFRNPGDKATLGTVTIMNGGEAALDVSALVLGGNTDDFSVVDPTGGFSIPGLGSQVVTIRFAPHVAGKVEEALLIVQNNDGKVAGGMPQVVLSGNGKERNVTATPGSVDAGDTFAGVPTRVSVTNPAALITLVNNELPDDSGLARTDFRIRQIDVTGTDADAFEAVDLSGSSLSDRSLPAMGMESIDVIFKPSQVGDFEAMLVVYLDDDTTPQMVIPVRGRALWADAHGSGGCSTGRGSQGGLVLVLGALALTIRRRRR